MISNALNLLKSTYDFLFLGFIREGVTSETPTSLFEVLYLLLYPFNIFETELVLNDFHVARGVDISLHVYDFRVVESTNDLEYAIDSTYMRKERVSKSSTCRSALGSISLLVPEDKVMGLLTAVRPAMSMHVRCAGTREAGL